MVIACDGKQDSPDDSDAPISCVDATSQIDVLIAAQKGIRSRWLSSGNGSA